jgi:hypothetical protein
VFNKATAVPDASPVFYGCMEQTAGAWHLNALARLPVAESGAEKLTYSWTRKTESVFL